MQGIFRPVVEEERQLGKRSAGAPRQSFNDSEGEAESENDSEDGSKGACTGSDVDGDASDSGLDLGSDEEVSLLLHMPRLPRPRELQLCS